MPSRDDVRQHAGRDGTDLVLQLQLALLEAADLEHVRQRRGLQRLDRGVEVAVLLPQRVEAADEDVRFAGAMDKDTGVFTPAAAGPNPERKYQTNNAGKLKVIATVGEGAAAVSGEGQLLVTVQRWNNPPIR